MDGKGGLAPGEAAFPEQGAEAPFDTLIGHSRGDRIIPHSCSEEIAALMPQAKFLSMDSDNHVLLGDEPAWAAFSQAMRRFLAEPHIVAAAARNAPPGAVRLANPRATER